VNFAHTITRVSLARVRGAHLSAAPNDPDFLEDDDEAGDFCPGCNPEPTMEERDRGTCASCGKALL
jgi:hypothetical protein